MNATERWIFGHVMFVVFLFSTPWPAAAQLVETIGGDELGHCPPKSGEIGTGATQWTEDVDKDGDGTNDYRWNKEFTDPQGNVVRVYCLSKGGARFALTYDNKIVGICPYECGCNVGTIRRETPGGKIKETEWSSKDGEYSDADDDGDGDKDEMKYTYDVASNQLTSENLESGVRQVGQTNPPPTLGSGTLPPSWGTDANPKLTAAAIDTLFSSGCQCAAVGHWVFDELAGNALSDVSRDGHNDGIIVGATWDAGCDGGALKFDGVDDYVLVPHSPDFAIAEGTIEIIFRPLGGFSASDATEELFQKEVQGLADDDVEIFLGTAGGFSGRIAVEAEYAGAAYEVVSDGVPAPWEDWWYHVAYVFDASGMRLFVNSVLQVNQNAFVPSWINNSRDLVFGYNLAAATDAFDGWIDEVRISDRALALHEFLDCSHIPVAVPRPSPDATLSLRSYPNPFNPVTSIEYVVPKAGPVSLVVYDSRGRLVRALVGGTATAGEHTATWNGRDTHDRPVASGVYFLRFATGEEVRAIKAVLLK